MLVCVRVISWWKGMGRIPGNVLALYAALYSGFNITRIKMGEF